MHTFSTVFLATLGLGLLLQLWLMQRQARQVARHRDSVPEAFVEQVTLDQHQKAADYTQAKLSLGRIELLVGSLLLLGWTLGGGINVLDNWLRQFELEGIWMGVALILAFSLVAGLLDLPFSWWRTFVLEERFGFNRTTPGRFVKDLLLQTLIGLIIGVPLLWVILWLMMQAGSQWWALAWLFWMGFMLLMTWAYPTLIAPLFNKFTPLEEGELRERIQALLQRCGFASDGIFIMDGSKRSGHGNAYFTGFGKNKRIVFFDTLANSLQVDEMEAVLAHELGHFKRRHILKHLVLTSLITLAGFALLGWLMNQAWFYFALGVDNQSNGVALLLFMLVIPVFSQFLSPAMAMLSRRHEFEADDFAVAQAGAEPMIRALVKLYSENASTLTPDLLYSAFHDSHPPAPIRVAYLSTRTAAENHPE